MCPFFPVKDLAMSSRFRAETLESLANASYFKRTHAFLMDVWEAFVIGSFVSSACWPLVQMKIVIGAVP